MVTIMLLFYNILIFPYEFFFLLKPPLKFSHTNFLVGVKYIVSEFGFAVGCKKFICTASCALEIVAENTKNKKRINRMGTSLV